MTRQLTESQRINILIARSKEVPVKVIARQQKVSIWTIYRTVKTYENEQRVSRKKYYRASSIDQWMLENMREYVELNRFALLVEIKNDLQINASISRWLKKIGLSCRVSPRKFLISNVNKEKRVHVVRIRLQWDQQFWNKIVFTDESGIDNSGKHRRLVRRPRGTRMQPEFVFKHQNKTCRLNFFSYVTAHGLGDLIFYEKMNSEFYCDQIVPVMMNKLRETFGSEDFFVIHDNARFSQSKHTKKYLRDSGYADFFIEQPTYSPDRNLIENLWAILKF